MSPRTRTPLGLAVCECGCGGEAHDLVGELGECLECGDCLRYRPVTSFDPDADAYDVEHPRDGESCESLPFDHLCDCGGWKPVDRESCDDCDAMAGGDDA